MPDKSHSRELPRELDHDDAICVVAKADVDRYFEGLANPDVFAKDCVQPLRPATLKSRRKMILQIATAIVRSGWAPETIANLPLLVQPQNAEAAIRFFYERAGNQKKESLHHYTILLRDIARRRTIPDDPVRALLDIYCHNFAVKKTGMTERNRERLRQFDDPANVDALLVLPDRLLQQAQDGDKGGWRDAMRVMYAVAIDLLIVAPMRVKNLTSLEYERHLVPTRIGPDRITHLLIPAEEMKNSEAYEMEVPRDTMDLLNLYLGQYRPRLADWQSPWLFPGYGDRERHPDAFSHEISEIVFRETGIRIHVHLFRHLAAKLYLEAHPGDIETPRRILGHKSIKTTMKSYVHVKNAAALRSFDEMIGGLRERARARLPRVQRSITIRGAA